MRTSEAIQLQYVGLCDNSELVKNAIKIAQIEAINELAQRVMKLVDEWSSSSINYEAAKLIDQIK